MDDEVLKAVEIEETVPRDTHEAVEGLIFNRYFHAIRDARGRRWTHADGAVKAFALSTYTPDESQTNGPKGSPVAYRKLWRLDGEIGDDDFGRLVAHHFRHNELVLEALGDVVDERPGATPQDTVEALAAIGARELAVSSG